MSYFDNFAPSSIAPVGAVSDQRIMEAQQLLKQLGYDPGTIDGVWGPRTQSALAALWMAVGKSEAPPTEVSDGLLNDLRALVSRQSMSLAPQQSLVETTKPPFWKGPLFIGLATVVGSVSLYLLFRETSSSVAGVEEEEKEEKEEKKPRKRTKKPEVVEGEVVKEDALSSAPSLVEKCPRPTVPEEFSSGTPLEETPPAPAT